MSLLVAGDGELTQTPQPPSPSPEGEGVQGMRQFNPYEKSGFDFYDSLSGIIRV